MFPLIAVLMLVLCLPLLLRCIWFLVKAHVVMIVLFLPAGLLLRYGRLEDLELYFAVTAAWATLVLLALVKRRNARSA
jgi:hypothetical protein